MDDKARLFDKFLDFLDGIGALSEVVVVGSWDEFLYSEANILPGFEHTIKTVDADFLIKNLRRPSEPIELVKNAKSRGYTVASDRVTGVNKLYIAEDFEVEFLIGKMGAGREAALKTNLGVTAQSLRHMDVLKNNTVQIEWRGKTITVPTPEAYVAHKMMINRERGRKQGKDALAIARLVPLIDERVFRAVLSQLSKKELRRVDEFEKDVLPAIQAELYGSFPLDDPPSSPGESELGDDDGVL